MNKEWIWKNNKKKKSEAKNRKNSKNQSELPHVNNKELARKRIFCSNTAFSFYFKIKAKKLHRAKPLFFAPLPVSA